MSHVPGRGCFRAVPSQNGDKYVTSPPPQSLHLSVPTVVDRGEEVGLRIGIGPEWSAGRREYSRKLLYPVS